VRLRSNDNFAANFVRDSMFAAELDHGRGSGNAQPRLEGSGLVINAGVDDTAVVPALMARHGVFLFKKQKPLPGKPARDFEGNGESDDSGANNHNAVPGVVHWLVVER